MKVDLLIGAILYLVAWFMGFGADSFWMFFAVFLPDLDIPWNEFWRIFIKREKKFSFSTLLDEYSYTHKFWFHNPLVTLPVVYFVANWYLGYLFALLVVLAVFAHFIHDTIDHNFDGVRWLWPFSWKSIKLSDCGWEMQEATELSAHAEWLRWRRAGSGRTTNEILKDNL